MYEFDLKTLWNKIWASRKMILRNCGIAAVVAVVIAYSIPKTYVANVELAAELKEESGLGGSAASLASLAGINLGGGADAIGPDLYPNVMSSNEFLVKLLKIQVRTEKGDFEGSYVDYLENYQKSPWWSYPVIWVKALLKGDKKDGQDNMDMDPTYLTSRQDNLVTAARMLVRCAVDEEDGTISIGASAQDPMVAKILVDSATLHLQNFITSYRTNKARTDLEYYQKLEREAKEGYVKAQKEYAKFCDSHRELSLKSYVTKQESLENDLQLAFTAYSQMKQQVQLAMAKVQENTPAFTVLQAASVPILPDAPRKKIIFLGLLFVVFIGSLGWVYFKLLFFTRPTVEEQKQLTCPAKEKEQA